MKMELKSQSITKEKAMARARNIKPSFFQNEELGELLPIERLAFIGMWTIADFRGCIELRPKRLKVQILPYDDCDFNQITNNLEQSGLISTYSVAGQRYIKLLNFEKHQNPHKNERDGGSDIPDISERDDLANKNSNLKLVEINHDKDGTAPADSLFPLTDSSSPSNTLSDKSDVSKNSANQILDHLNLKASRKFKDVKANISIITARLKEFSFEELIAVIDDRCLAWASDEKMHEYLRPETLFNATKCAGYVGSLGAAPATVAGKPWFLTASGIEAKGVELRLEKLKDESFPDYKRRVVKASGLTEEEYRKAKQDFEGKKAA
jgi:uncharacterized phage protein (TIGR02220 family)